MFLNKNLLKTASELLRPVCKIFDIKYFLLLWEGFVTPIYPIFAKKVPPKIRDSDNDLEGWDEV